MNTVSNNVGLDKSKKERPDTVRGARMVAPRVDVYENASEILLMVDVPGIGPDGLVVKVEDGTLHLSATRAPADPKAPALVYERAFTLPDGIDVANIAAELDRGVASLHLPKHEKAKPRQIPVRSAR